MQIFIILFVFYCVVSVLLSPFIVYLWGEDLSTSWWPPQEIANKLKKEFNYGKLKYFYTSFFLNTTLCLATIFAYIFVSITGIGIFFWALFKYYKEEK